MRWAAATQAARHAEITELLARPELAHTRRLRFTHPASGRLAGPSRQLTR
jgi:hypothetical protein